MPAPVHLLTTDDLRQVTVVCRATRPERGTWHRALVTCPRCLEPPRWRVPGSKSGMAERELQEVVRKAAQLGQWRYFHVWNSRHSPAGYPDTTLVRDDRLIFAELKALGKTPTTDQVAWLQALAQVRQVTCYVWHPDDLPTILEVLR